MCLYCYETKHTNTTRELRAALNLSSRTYVPVPSPHRMQMQDAECRSGPKAVHCTRCRMQMQDAECRSGPKAVNWYPMQDADAECRMQNRPHGLVGGRLYRGDVAAPVAFDANRPRTYAPPLRPQRLVSCSVIIQILYRCEPVPCPVSCTWSTLECSR